MSNQFETIRWVRGNLRPLLSFIIKDRNTGNPYDPDTWLPMDLSGKTVTMQFRKKGTTTLLSTLSSTFETDGTDGHVNFIPDLAFTDNPAGSYEGEIDIDYGLGNIQTIYDKVSFTFREGH